MSRRSVAKKRPVAPDPVYQSRLVSLLVSPFKEGEEKYRLQHFLFGNEEYCRDNITRST